MAQDTTWASNVLSEADINAFLMHEGNAWTTYTPTLTQSGAVTKTTNYGSYGRAGRLIYGNVRMTCTGSGTASNVVGVGLPVATHASSAANTIIGSAVIFDSSAATFYTGVLLTQTSTVAGIPATGTSTLLGAVTFTAALASGDIVSYSFCYEAAT